MNRPTTIIVLLLTAAGCAALAGGTVPSAQQVAASSEMNLDSLLNGRALYQRECMACHRQYFPEEYSPRAWESIIPQMSDRVGRSAADTHDVMLFVTEASRLTRNAPPPSE